MHLQEKNKKCNHRHNCDCNKKAQRFDEAYTSAPSTLEEHFESFTGAVGEVAEDFLGLGKKAKAKRQAKRAPVSSAPVTAAPSLEEEIILPAPSKLVKIASGVTKSPNLKNQAENQALQVNQLASMVQPSSKAVTPSETATASGTEGGSEELYKTLPDSEEKAQESPAASEQTAKGTEAVPVEEAAAPAKSTKKTGLIVIAVVIISVIAWLKFKKKI